MFTQEPADSVYGSSVGFVDTSELNLLNVAGAVTIGAVASGATIVVATAAPLPVIGGLTVGAALIAGGEFQKNNDKNSTEEAKKSEKTDASTEKTEVVTA